LRLKLPFKSITPSATLFIKWLEVGKGSLKFVLIKNLLIGCIGPSFSS
jgi:hypothetical protein